ncbi:MAG: thioredoxin reductase [Nitrospira bacterium HGW-Nitrospira-1]|nr:MAG: thioredoxin reductase [Nitrospira bacterium HGW-Nitrospira-1]
MENIYDVLIIGGGPAGLSAAQYASRAQLKTIVLDKSSTAGALAYTSHIENYPGVPGPISGKELLDIFRKQALDFGAEYVIAQVVGVKIDSEIKEVYTMETSYKGRSIIIATGAMGKKPTIKGEAEFLGRGVSYCAVCDAAFYKGRAVCVIGNSEEAVKEAGYLTKFAETVYLISPTKELKVERHPAQEAPNLKVLTGTVVTAIEGSAAVEKIKIMDQEKKASELSLSGVFVYMHGSKPIVDFLFGAMSLTEEGCIESNRIMETPTPGVFAAGDVACTEVRQVVTAVASGAVAALSAEKYLRRRSRHKYDWGK